MKVLSLRNLLFNKPTTNLHCALVIVTLLGLVSVANLYVLLGFSFARVEGIGEILTFDDLQRKLHVDNPSERRNYYDVSSDIDKVFPKKMEDDFVVDVVSVGSVTKPEYQNAQERTIRKHSTVRNFFRITELNDTDRACSTDLTMEQLHKVVSFCKRPFTDQSVESSLIRRLVYHPKNHGGWMCAQKRPIDGLYLALQKYKTEIPPTYLFIIDDDSYFNMDSIVHTLQTNHTQQEPNIITGCPYNYPQKAHFVFPYGGFATLLSQKAIQNLMQPIYCNVSDVVTNGFVQSVCWRLQQNLMGEAQFFQDGMSVGDLMYTYASQLAFTDIDAWTNGVGFCFHSDHALGYFFGFYHIAVPDEQLTLESSTYAWLRRKYGYIGLAGQRECRNIKKRCHVDSRMCHYVEPDQMDRLFAEQQKITSSASK
jgi:hypothetical protein